MPFAPTDISSLWAWFKADAGVTGTTTVTAWADQSGNGRNLTSESGKQPRLVSSVINSLPVLKNNDGVGGFGTPDGARMSTSGNFPVGNWTAFVVGAQSVGTLINDSYGVFVYSDGPFLVLNRQDATNKIASSNFPEISVSATNTTFYTIRGSRNQTSGDTAVSLNNGTPATGNFVNAQAAAPLFVFDDNFSDFGNKQIAEILVFDGLLTDNETALVEYYLQQKYNHFTWVGAIPTNSTTMAVTKLDANDIALSISTNTTTPAYKEVVCVEDHSLEGSTNVTKRKTRCGTMVFTDDPEWTITTSGAANITPGGSEISAQELMVIAQANADILWKLHHRTDPTKYYRQGTGRLSAYTETGSQGDAVSFDLTIEVDGSIDAVS